MNISREEKKAFALELMKKLDIFKPYIQDLKRSNKVCYFDEFIGFWAYQNEELIAKVKQFEEEENCLVYAITHEYTKFGELYDFLLVPDYKEDWDLCLEEADKGHFAFAYVWNKDDDFCSEYGTIQVMSYGGGIKRIG